MMTVSGQYQKSFDDATHVIFEGHLDNHVFRRIAIQKIVICHAKTVVLETSGVLPRHEDLHGEFTIVQYADMFGKHQTTGRPFKDADAALKEIE